MSGTRDGALRRAAAMRGLSLEQYEAKVAAGEKWCTGCKAWHPRAAFRADRSRADGLKAACARASYRPAAQPCLPLRYRHGRLAPTRDGDKRQARARVNYLARAGRIARPNELACADCGHEWRPGERRHEYDHHQGYGASQQLAVQAVCTRCHHRRERERTAQHVG